MNEPLELADVDLRPPRSYFTPLATVCPTCNAGRGQDCRGFGGQPMMSHPDRAEAEMAGAR